MSESTEIGFRFNDKTRTLADWAKAGPTASARLNAEVYAAREGAAGCVLPEGGLMLYYRSGIQIRSRYWPKAIDRGAA